MSAARDNPMRASAKITVGFSATLLIVMGLSLIALETSDAQYWYRSENPTVPVNSLLKIGEKSWPIYCELGAILVCFCSLCRAGRSAFSFLGFRIGLVATMIGFPVIAVPLLDKFLSTKPPIPEAELLVEECETMAQDVDSIRMAERAGQAAGDLNQLNEVPKEYWPQRVRLLEPRPLRVLVSSTTIRLVQSESIDVHWGIDVCRTNVGCPIGLFMPTTHRQVFHWEWHS